MPRKEKKTNMENTTLGFIACEQRCLYHNGKLMGGEVRDITDFIKEKAREERMRLEEFYQTLNQMSSDDRFSKWEFHRNTISKYMTELFEKLKHKRVLIIGSGNCDDLDLDVIEKYAESIVFVDLDDQSTYTAIQMRTPALLNKSTIVKKDVSGLYDQFQMLKGVLENGNEKEILASFRKVYKTKQEEPLFNEQFDFVIVLPIFTQMVAPYLLETGLYKENARHPVHKINAEIIYLSNTNSNTVLSRIFDCVKPGGYMLALSDLFNANDEAHIKYFKQLSADNLYEIISNAKNEGTFYGAQGFFRWFPENLNKFRTIVSSAWLWHYDELKQYAVYNFGVQKIE